MRPIKRAIILCWIMLVACFAIKLFGGNWFEIVCTNEHFSNFCKFFDDRIVLQDILSLVFYAISTSLVILSSARKTNPSKKQLLFVVLSTCAIWSLQLISLTAKAITETVYLVFCPIIINFFLGDLTFSRRNALKEIGFGAIGATLTWVFQVLSFVTRNIGVSFVGDTTLIALILMTDYYIMIILYYMYVKSKEGGKKYG